VLRGKAWADREPSWPIASSTSGDVTTAAVARVPADWRSLRLVIMGVLFVNVHGIIHPCL
jgi:hypothetical protein